jgi:hypothetical protein
MIYKEDNNMKESESKGMDEEKWTISTETIIDNGFTGS